MQNSLVKSLLTIKLSNNYSTGTRFMTKRHKTVRFNETAPDNVNKQEIPANPNNGTSPNSPDIVQEPIRFQFQLR